MCELVARRWGIAAVVVAAIACTGKPAGSGGGGNDSAATSPAAGDTDAGSADAGSPQAPAPDAGTPDAGVADAGTGSGIGPADAGGGGASDGGVTLTPPVTRDGWTFYDQGQGLPGDVSDVSADEGGNVYVAGGDALYAKKRGDDHFLRFDAANAGLTRNCYAVVPDTDPSFAAALDAHLHPDPPGAPIMCPIVSVAGTGAGAAVIGFKGLGTDSDGDADWALDSGGADVVKFDGTTLARDRHVFVASPPNTVCAAGGFETHGTSCSNPYDYYWNFGRRKARQIFRIVVNHRHGTAQYGDVWMGGTHATVAALLNDASSRGYLDRTAGQPAKWADAKAVWEHDHPAIYDAASNLFLTGYTYALAIDPRSGTPWGSNGFRTAWVNGYGGDLHSDVWWLDPIDAAHPLWIDVWPDGTGSPLGSQQDHIESLSFCEDGTLWMGSTTHALARMDPGGGLSGVSLPDPGLHGDNVYAVACDPSDGSLWIGLGWGGLMRYKNGQFTLLHPDSTPGLPAFVGQPVRSIQIDRWSTPRTVYFAFIPSRDASGQIIRPGGVAAYSGP